MSAVMERKQAFEPVNYFDHRTVGAQIVRWVFNPLDLIIPERKSEAKWMMNGGEESPTPCLRRFGNNFMPRGLPAILELGGDPIPMRHLGDLQASAWAGMPLNEHAVKNNFGFVPVYPGDGLKVLRRYAMNNGERIPKGVDEVTALLGKEWDECYNGENYCEACQVAYPPSLSHCIIDSCNQPLTRIPGTGIMDVVMQAAFGDGIAPTLRGLEEQIRHAKVNDSRLDYGKYRDETSRMCNEARIWAERKVGTEHSLLRKGSIPESSDAVGTRGGWAYAYSPMCELLLDQLEIPRQDQPLTEMARMIGQQSQQPIIVQTPAPAPVFDADAWEQRMDAKLAEARAADAARIAELEAKLANKADRVTKSLIKREKTDE